ncbi:MAG: thiamine pyrophosphate-dependent enzyme [Pseudomonadota bacterium]|nr:thiamine pyrophosphate-dependent enzyme [Pseudomonadota bacterium]MEC8128131.1 thiamine pyrophosphate-dependent enzyme [Pseudomonadota bacterium]
MTTTIAKLAVEALIANGITQLYCLPGVQNDHFFNALFDHTDAITPIQTRHEQGAAYMATGAALATGEPQAYCVVPGPGFLNTTAALSTAYALNAPVLALVGQIPTGAQGKGHGLLHEIPDQIGILERLTKTSHRVTGGEDAARHMVEAFTSLVSGRPQPVGLEIAVNLWTQAVTAEIGDLAPPGRPAPVVDSDVIERAASMIAAARAPMIVVGGGAQDDSGLVRQLAARIGAPAVAFRTGHGVIPSDDPHSIGMPVAHSLWPDTDLVIGLGTRLQSQVMSWGHDADMKIIHIDIDENQIGRSAPVDVGIHARLSDALPMLIRALDQTAGPNHDWTARVADAKARRQAEYTERLGPQLEWLGAIRDALPRDGIFVDELTQTGYVSRFAFPSFHPRSFISTGYQGTLGYGFATALGVAHARRDVPVLSISGDGGALFTISELATAVHHNIPLTTVIFNDHAFGNVRRLQMDNYDSRLIASDLSSPDFISLAESFGAQGLLATSPNQLRAAIETALLYDGPSIIEVPLGEVPSPWDFVLMPRQRGG